jgi:hypothetical protein
MSVGLALLAVEIGAIIVIVAAAVLGRKLFCEAWASQCCHAPIACHGHPGQAYHTSLALAEWLGSIRRECLDHIIVLGEANLRQILQSYACYYNDIRTHRSLDKDAPVARRIQRIGSIKSHAIGGLHHHYVRA